MSLNWSSSSRYVYSFITPHEDEEKQVTSAVKGLMVGAISRFATFKIPFSLWPMQSV